MARRGLGELHTSRSMLERAWESAIELDDAVMASHIAVSLALVVAFQGELENALQILDVSEPGLPEGVRGHLRGRQGASSSLIDVESPWFARAVQEYHAGAAGCERRCARRAPRTPQPGRPAQLPRSPR